MSREEREREYYNDMPGKVPPDVGPPPIPPLPNLNRDVSPEPRGENIIFMEIINATIYILFIINFIVRVFS